MTTVHAYTSSQSIVDGPSKRFRRGRAAAANLVPATTGAALRDHACAASLRRSVRRRCGPGADSCRIDRGHHFRHFAEDDRGRGEPESLRKNPTRQRYAGVLGVSRDPLVSSDIIGDPRASIVDLELTKVIDGDLVKVMSWYDNEWGYANQMVREAVSISIHEQ